jgi:hypothetical protein
MSLPMSLNSADCAANFGHSTRKLSLSRSRISSAYVPPTPRLIGARCSVLQNTGDASRVVLADFTEAAGSRGLSGPAN